MTSVPTRGAYIYGQNGGTPLNISGANAFTPGSMLIATMMTLAATTTTPTGWTQILAPVTLGTRQMTVWAKIRNSADGDTYSFVQSTGVTKSVAIAEILGSDATIANLVIGSFGTRAASGGAFKNTAPSLTTPVANCLVLTLSGEATTAAEGSLPVVSGSTKWFDVVQAVVGAATVIEQVTSATLGVAAAGATAAVDVTYPNTQGTNGGALQIGIRPAADVTPPAPVGAQIGYWDGATETKYNLSMLNGDGSETALAALSGVIGTKSPLSTRLLDPAPLYCAHRGGSANWPEHSPQAYLESAVIWNMDAIEVSVQKSADGTFWVSHDATTTRATGTTGTISAMTDAQLAVLRNISGSTDNPTQPSSPLMRLTDVLALYAGKRIIFLEDKTYANQAAVIALAQTYASADWFVWKQDGTGNKNAGSATAGWKSWGYFFDSGMAASFASKQAQWDFVGLDYLSSDATLDAAILTAGAARCIPHIIPSLAEKNRIMAKGVRGLMIANVRDCLPKW